MSPRRGRYPSPSRRRPFWAAWLLVSSCLLARSAAAQPTPEDKPAAPPRYDNKGRPIAPKAPQPPRPQQLTPPKLLRYADPEYPASAKQAGIEAEVILKLTIDRDGRVSDATVLEPAGHGFDEAALAAAPKLLFSPARKADGNPFKAIIKFRYRFVLQAAAPVDPEPPAPAPAPAAPAPAAPAPATEPAAADPALPAVIDVLVEGDSPPREMTHRSVEKREIERIPGTNGDALRAIQNLPGVARTQSFVGALIVRGSAPFDSSTFIDGVYVPLIYHFGGLSSVVPTELIEHIDFYPGNFSSRFGRAMGGIVDVGLRAPRSDGYHGLIQIDLIDARVMVEGPIPLLEGWTFAAAGRRSYFDAWLGPVLEAVGAGVTQAPRYWDYQFMINKKWEQGSFKTAFYGSDDSLRIIVKEPSPGEPALSGNIGFSTVFQRLQSNLEHHIDRNHTVRGVLALGHEQIGLSVGNLFLDLGAYSVFSRLEHAVRLADNVRFNWGFDVTYSSVNWAARLPPPTPPGQPPNQPFSTATFQSIDQNIQVIQPAVYLEAELTPHSRWRIVPGVRVDWAGTLETLDVDPRLLTRFDIMQGFPRTTVKAAVGLYSQAPQPQQYNEPLGTANLESNRAIHYGLGVEQEITPQIEISLEGFYKDIRDVVVEDVSAAAASVEYNNQGTRRVFGGELLLKYKADERFFGWLAYTLSRASRKIGPDAEEVLLPWSQTHVLTLLGSYRLGNGWEAGARFRLASGNLIDANVCNFTRQSCDPSRINALYHAPSGAYVPIPFSGDNEERLPLFHQLDLRVDKSWTFDDFKISAYLDVQNAYNKGNVEGVSYDYRFSTRQYVTGIPILPSLGLRGEL